MSKTAFLFPGQGSQTVGMGRDLSKAFPIARQTFEEANEALGFDLAELAFHGPEEQLRLTEFTQPAIFTASIAAYRVLREHVPPPGLCRRPLARRVFRESCRRRFALSGCGSGRTQAGSIDAASRGRGTRGDGGDSRHEPPIGPRGLRRRRAGNRTVLWPPPI